MTVPDLLRSKADMYLALRQEHCVPGDQEALVFLAVEVVLREIAATLECELEEAA